MSVKDGTISCKFYTSKEAKPKKVSLKVSQSGKNFTLRRYVGGKVNYTAKSKKRLYRFFVGIAVFSSACS